MPQGSILEPLYILIDINDLPLASNFNIKLFGDDTALTMFHVSGKSLTNSSNKERIKIEHWLKINKL